MALRMLQKLGNWFRTVPVSTLLQGDGITGSALSPSGLDGVRATQIDLLYEMDRGAGLRPVIVFFVTTLLLSGFTSAMPWAAFGLYCAIWIGFHRLQRLNKESSQERRRKNYQEWAWWFGFASLCSGLGWGFGSTVWFDPSDGQNQAIVSLIIVGIGASSIISRAVHLPSLIAFMVPATAPITLSLLFTGTLSGLALAGLALLFISGLYGWGKILNRWQLDSIALQFQNQSLVASLSEQKEAANAARKAAEAANKTKTEFLATMSHEVRTPLNGILGMARVLQLSELDKEQQEYLDVIVESGESLGTILNDILDLSKMEAGRLDIETKPFEALTLCQSVVRLFASSAQAKGIELGIDPDIKLDTMVQGDAHRVRQVLINLIGNAVKFTEHGRISVTFAPAGSSRLPPGVGTGDGASQIVFAIVDTGIGIAPKAQSRLFEAFQQADQSTTRKFGGSGLGLAICKRLVGLMSGKIGLVSEPGKGSTFWFALPIASPKPSEQTAQPYLPDRQLPGSRKGQHILLVEDNTLNAKVATTILMKSGYIVARVCDGQEALDLISANIKTPDLLPDLILMDIRMPRLSGPDAAKAIKELGSPAASIPIIALSADLSIHDDRADAVSSVPAEYADVFDGALGKPISLERLQKIVQHHLGSPTTMNQFHANDPRYDADHLQGLLSTLGAETFDDLIETYEDDLAGIEEGLALAYAQNDAEQAKQFAHNLAGASANLGFTALAEAARALQKAAVSDESHDLAAKHRSLTSALSDTKDALREIGGRSA